MNQIWATKRNSVYLFEKKSILVSFFYHQKGKIRMKVIGFSQGYFKDYFFFVQNGSVKEYETRICPVKRHPWIFLFKWEKELWNRKGKWNCSWYFPPFFKNILQIITSKTKFRYPWESPSWIISRKYYFSFDVKERYWET